MPAVDTTVVAAILAGHLHLEADDPGVVDAVDAAVVYVRTYTGRSGDGLELPDDALTVAGLVVLAERIYLDPSSPGGQIGGMGDPSFTPVYTSPEDLAAHNHHYWDRLTLYDAEVPGSGWGIA